MKNVLKTTDRRQPGRPKRCEQDRAPLLLQAARNSFAKLGFKGATLRGIAAAAGVDHTLVSHRFGSKEALWSAVVEQQTEHMVPFIEKLRTLHTQSEISIKIRIETAFRCLIDAAFGEMECGLLLARISSERGKQLDMLVEKLLRPPYEALYPLLEEAVQAKVIKRQKLDLLYFMILNAIAMSLSYRHVLGYFGNDFENLVTLQEDMTQFLLLNFLRVPTR